MGDEEKNSTFFTMGVAVVELVFSLLCLVALILLDQK